MPWRWPRAGPARAAAARVKPAQLLVTGGRRLAPGPGGRQLARLGRRCRRPWRKPAGAHADGLGPGQHAVFTGAGQPGLPESATRRSARDGRLRRRAPLPRPEALRRGHARAQRPPAHLAPGRTRRRMRAGVGLPDHAVPRRGSERRGSLPTHAPSLRRGAGAARPHPRPSRPAARPPRRPCRRRSAPCSTAACRNSTP